MQYTGPNRVLIRPVEARDADAWAAMRARLWPDADPSELAREAHAFVAGSGDTILDAVFLARDNQSRPVGFLELSLRRFSDGCDSTPVPHVEGWFVKAAARGHGLGRALLHSAEDWARARGFGELASDAELSNTTSQTIHERCGFAEVERLVKFRKLLA